MTAPSGSDYQVGYCFERSNNVPGAAINKFFYAKSVTGLFPQRQYERSGNILPSGRTPGGVITRIPVDVKFGWEPDVDSIAARRAWHNNNYAIATLAAGAYEWTYQPKEKGDSVAAYVDSTDHEITDGDGFPILMTGCRQSDLEIKIADGKIVEITESMMGCFDTYSSTATGTSSTYTAKPVLIGHWGKTITTVKVKVFAVADSSNVFYVKFTYNAVAYTGSNIGGKFNIWIRCTPGDGSRVGVNRNDDLWILFPSTAAGGGSAGAVSVNDEWTFTPQRTLASPTYSTRDPLSTAGFEVTLDGTQYGGVPNQPGFKSATMKVTFPKAPNFAGGLQAHSIQRNGDPMLTIKVGRDREDRALLERCHNAERIAVVLNMWGNPIGSTGFDELWQFSVPKMEVTALVRDVNTKNVLPEDADLVAVGIGGRIYTEKTRCTVASI